LLQGRRVTFAEGLHWYSLARDPKYRRERPYQFVPPRPPPAEFAFLRASA
jgi:hypothetical protein